MIIHQPTNSIGNHSYNITTYKNTDWQTHFHKNFEIIYVIQGEVLCSVGGKEKILKENEFGMILSNEIHSYISKKDSVYWVIVFSGDFVHAFEKQVKNKVSSNFKFICNETVTTFFKNCLLNNSNYDTYMLKSCLYALCSEFLKHTELLDKSTKNDILMQKIVDYISLNYKNKITLSSLAKELGYNYHYLSKSLNKIFDISFNEFLNSYRLDNAIIMLIETDKTITEIALESGFQSVRSFNQFFKFHIGVSPTQYKKRL